MEKSQARVLPYQIILALKNWSGREENQEWEASLSHTEKSYLQSRKRRRKEREVWAKKRGNPGDNKQNQCLLGLNHRILAFFSSFPVQKF